MRVDHSYERPDRLDYVLEHRRRAVDEAPVVPLFTLKQVDIVSRRVGNYQFHPQWGVLFGQLWVR